MAAMTVEHCSEDGRSWQTLPSLKRSRLHRQVHAPGVGSAMAATTVEYCPPGPLKMAAGGRRGRRREEVGFVAGACPWRRMCRVCNGGCDRSALPSPKLKCPMLDAAPANREHWA